MRKAYMFQSITQFSDFVRLFGDKSSSNRGFTLYRVRHPEHPAQTTLLLFGFRKPRKSWTADENLLQLEELQLEEHDTYLLYKRKDLPDLQFEILQTQHTLTLLEQIELKPWRNEPENTGQIIFWLHKPELVSWLVTTSLKLNNDRIQFANIEHEQHQHSLLLRIEAPSYYLIQWCQEQHDDDLDLYYPLTHNTFVQWGHQHPLQDLWLRAQATQRDQWLFFHAHTPRQHIQPLQWQDIYSATSFSLDFPVESSWSQTSKHKPQLPVRLRLEHRGRPLDPELWLLEENEQPHLERLLSMVDEEDLKTLLISIQLDDQQRRRFIIREKHMGEGRQFLDFGGKQFANYKGFHNLFLPIQYELQPQLRRDQYRKLFALQNGELTLLVPPDLKPQDWQGNLEKAQILKFKENSFEPIIRLIDYLMTSNANQLQTLLQRSVFDFGHYARSPRRPDLGERKNSLKKSEDLPEKEPKSLSPQHTGKTPLNTPDDTPTKHKTTPEKTNKNNIKIEVKPSQLEAQEAKLERQLIQEGQKPDTWSALLDTKTLLKKWTEATDCAFEALWLFPSDTNTLHQQLRDLLDHQLNIQGTPGKRLDRAETLARKEKEPIAVVAYILHGQLESSNRLNDWLQTASELLRSVEPKLRKKTFWLMWRELLQHNGDVREQARVRETLINELNQNGLAPYDIPHFIQSRLFQERWLQPDDEDSSGELGAAHSNLDLIKEYVDQFPAQHLRTISYSILARAFSRIGYHAQAHLLLQDALSEAKSAEDYIQAWVTLYCIQAIQAESSSESREYRQQYAKIIEKMEKAKSQHLNTILEVETTLKDRIEIDNPAEFLSRENFKRFYPTSASPANEETQQAFLQLKTAFETGQRERLFPCVETILDHATNELNDKKHPDLRGLSWLMHSMIEIINKMRWGTDGRKLIQRFEEFVRSIPQSPPDNKMNAFYYLLLRLSLAQGLMELGNELLANNLLQETLHGINQRDEHLVSLDFIDMCSSALKIIEGAQLHSRRDSFKLLMQGMLSQMTGKNSTPYSDHSFSSFVLKLIDQAVEAALSKEKLTLGLYKQYMDQDELLIRERILHEDVCALALSSGK